MDTNHVSINAPGCSAGGSAAPEPGTATLLSIGLLVGLAGPRWPLAELSKRAA